MNKTKRRLGDVMEAAIEEALNGVQLPMDVGEKDFEISENRIYFYCEVTPENILKLNKALRDIDNTNQIYQLARQQEFLDKIYIHINSGGGSLHDGLLAMDQIEKTKSEVITIVDGFAASAATLMTLAGTHKQINKHGYMLIHQLSAGVVGTYENIKDEGVNCKKLMKNIKEIYLTKTKIPENKLEELLKHDIILSAEECLEYGLVDEII